MQDRLEISLDAYKGYTIKRFTSPDRIVIDIPKVAVSSNPKNIKVNSKRVKAVRYALFEKNTARIVLDTVGQPQYYAEEKAGKLVLYIVNQINKGVSYYNDSGKGKLVLTNIKLTGSAKAYTEKYEQSGKKYTITFSSKLAKLDNKTVQINDSLITSVQVKNDKNTQKTSISVNAKERFNYKVVQRNDVKGTEIEIVRAQEANRGDQAREDDIRMTAVPTSTPNTLVEEKPQATVNPEKTAEPQATLQPETTAQPQETVQPQESPQPEETVQPVELAKDFSVKYSPSENGGTQVDVSVSNYSNYNIIRLTNPNRIVLDIPNVSVKEEPQTINVNGKYAKDIRYAQYEDTTARVVIDTVGQPQYSVEEKQGQLTLVVHAPQYKNITYSNSGDRVYFILDKMKLTEGSKDLKKLYTEKFDETGLKYTITFKSSIGDIGKGTIYINDGLINTVDITVDNTSKQTSITFNAKEKFVYNTFWRDLTNDTAITILKPFSKEDKLIVIDPGHGGIDPGATYGDLKEKTLNLDISLRLNKLLKEKGVKTYILRENDVYLGIYERAYIANKLNAALYLSVHNNAYYTSYKGTETLYYPGTSGNGFGKKFAQIIQDSLVGTLKTYNRGIKSRTDLGVLKGTTMPAALAEVGFITNSGDRALLQTENFRQKAAQALCDSVIKALEEVK